MSEVFTEITALSDKDCFHIVDRQKDEFTYPLHQHKDFELNFVENGSGVRRIVGDSVEEIGDFDLVLIGGKNLEHVWQQGSCKSKCIREITIQFPTDIFGDFVTSKNQFAAIGKMLKRADHGLAFSMSTIMKVYSVLDTLAADQDHFEQFLKLLHILNVLAKDADSRVLASTSFAHAEKNTESSRVQKVKQYIIDNYQKNLSLEEMAQMVGMTPSAFSRYFKLRTGRTLSDYIIDIRLGNAARALVDSTKNISDICFECGFNNVSNFNRIFKSKRGTTPKEFRNIYKKNKVTV